jgi:hypothetical protein
MYIYQDINNGWYVIKFSIKPESRDQAVLILYRDRIYIKMIPYFLTGVTLVKFKGR